MRYHLQAHPPAAARHVVAVSDPASYGAAQPLGSAMRAADVHAFRYGSARDADGRVCVGAFEPAVFGRRQPRALQTWDCTATRERVEVLRRSFSFERGRFLVRGKLPAPAFGG
jgi:hypothetical protein